MLSPKRDKNEGVGGSVGGKTSVTTTCQQLAEGKTSCSYELGWKVKVMIKEIMKGQATESGIPQPSRATVRYSRIHLGFWPRSATLIGQLSIIPDFDTNSLRYIVPRFLTSAVTAF